MAAKYWQGSPPENCDICKKKLVTEFVDGKTTMGPWGNLCIPCHRRYGVGLGTGKGQHYVKKEEAKFEKVAG